MEEEATTTTTVSTENMWPVFFASLSSVGTAAALAASGFYLHRWGYISQDGKKTLGRYSQQVALPALFFSKMVACGPSKLSPSYQQQTNDSSQEENPTTLPPGVHPDTLLFDVDRTDTPAPQMCPNMWDSISLHHALLVLVWPFFVVGCGLVVGNAVCWVSQTPMRQWRTIMVSVAFANSTGLPTTLLAVLQEHAAELWSATTPSQLDPSSVLSLYLVFFPVLHWGLGGWLLSSERDNNLHSTNSSGIHMKPSNDSEEILLTTDTFTSMRSDVGVPEHSTVELANLVHRSRGSSSDEEADFGGNHHNDTNHESTVLGTTRSSSNSTMTSQTDCTSYHGHCNKQVADSRMPAPSPLWLSSAYSCFSETFLKQPPVCGALLGLVACSWVPLRQIFVGTLPPAGASYIPHPPLEWLLDAITTLGRSAVPINMAVLGANLSIAATTPPPAATLPSAATTNRLSRDYISYSTILAVVVGKLVLMPLIGFLSVRVLLYLIRHGIGREAPPSPALLVMMMVFLTPTSNTVMLMVDLVDGLKEEMARIMAWEYVFAPFLLSCTVAVAVEIARSVN